MKMPAEPSVILTVDKLVYGGWGLAHQSSAGHELQSQVVFIPDVLPEEKVQAKILSRHKGYLKATPIQVLNPSPHRIHPPCPVFGTCGGCHLQHMDPEAQASYKEAMLQETLERIGKIRASPLPLITSPDSYHYRHRVQLKLLRQGRALRMGFFRRESHHLVPVEGCPLLHPRLEEAMKALQQPLQKGLTFLTHPKEIHLQYSSHTARILMVFYAEEVKPQALTKFYTEMKTSLPLAGVMAYTQGDQREVRGQPFLVHELKGTLLKIGDQTFAQPNWTVNERILDHLLEYARLKGNETVLELYSGMGNFSLFLARQAQRVIALESSPHAVRDARYNARTNQVTNLEMNCCPVEKGLRRLLKKPFPVDLVLLDPPRQGAGQPVLQQILKFRPPRILYLSCDPGTLARDLKFLLEQGYQLGRMQPFDLLPQTYHLEVLTELQIAPR